MNEGLESLADSNQNPENAVPYRKTFEFSKLETYVCRYTHARTHIGIYLTCKWSGHLDVMASPQTYCWIMFLSNRDMLEDSLQV